MGPESVYFLKINLAIVLFYAFYRLFFYKDTFFQWRRIALLCFFGISLAYPLLNIQEWIREQEPITAIADIYATVMLPELVVGSPAEAGVNWGVVFLSSLSYIYIGVCSLLLLRFIFQLFGLFRLAFLSPTRMLQQSKVHILNKPQGPFSFFKWIFIYPEAHTTDEVKEILAHEQTHTRQWHSVDVLLSELMCIFCWFNPFIWLMKREVCANLEFLADYNVLENGHDSKAYQYHLLKLINKKKVATLYNSFNVLPLKKRIRMMNKKRTTRIGRTKYLIFIPLAALLLLISNIESIARSTEKINVVLADQPNEPFSDIMVQADTVKVPPHVPQEVSKNDKDVVFEVVEQMPEFPGGNAAMMKFLASNIKFPENATKSNIQGRVIVQFVVDKEGKVINPRIVRPVDSELDAEALRVVSIMPTWIPGKQRGENVAVKYTVPIRFSSTDKESVIPVKIEPVLTDGSQVFTVVEQMPEFPEGVEAMMDYFRQNLKYPEEAKSAKIQGRVIVQFVVDKNGNVIDPAVVRNVDPSLDNEALRLINNMPKWKPGYQKGQAVSTKYTVPITFSLPD